MSFFKKFLIGSLGAAMLLVPVLGAQAADYGTDATVKATQGSLPKTVAGSTDIPGLIGTIVKIGLDLIGIIFFILILYAGWNWMTAQGNSEKIDKAKETMQSAAIGLVIVLAAYAITNFVFSALSSGTSDAASGTSGSSCDSNSVAECQGKSSGNSCSGGTCQFSASGDTSCICGP